MQNRHVGLLVAVPALLFTLFIPSFASAQVTNLFANGSVETATGSAPQNWGSNQWGTTLATFTYPIGGAQEGSRYVKTEVTTAGTGDAKWYPNHVAVTSGQTLTFSDYYQSSVPSFVEVEYKLSNNTYQYVRLDTLAAAGAWTPYQKSFTVPANVVSLTVYHYIQAAGTLSVDTYVLTTGTTTPPPPPTGSNLLANPSVETPNPGNANQPQFWNTNAWGGTVATYSYLATGAQEGTRAVRTQVTTAGTGDAKWYPNHVAVTPGQTLTFSNYYQSTVSSTITVEYLLANNTYQYEDLGTVAASASWQPFSKTFTVPANVASLTVYHHVSAVGTLSVDNYSLTSGTTTPPPPPTGVNLINNPSFETEATTLPSGWNGQSWGTNTPVFTYIKNSGHEGTHSAKVEITSYTNGDAKWIHNEIPVTPGESYRFSNWYHSSLETYVVVDFTRNDNTHYYLGLRAASASASWKHYTETFEIPHNVKSARVFHIVMGVGSLTVDDYSLTKITPQGFSRALVSITFDDGWEENISTALPVMASHGFDSSYFFATQFLEANPSAGAAAVSTIMAEGHEVGSHSVTHPNLVFVDAPTLDVELTQSKQYLEGLVGAGNVRNIATPYGTYNDAVIAKAKTLYNSLRSTDEGYNNKENFDQYRLKVQNLKPNTTLAEFQSWIAQAKADKSWLVLVYHVVSNTAGEAEHEGEYNTLLSDFVAQMNALDAADVAVVTTHQALQEVLPQVGVTVAVPSGSLDIKLGSTPAPAGVPKGVNEITLATIDFEAKNETISVQNIQLSFNGRAENISGCTLWDKDNFARLATDIPIVPSFSVHSFMLSNNLMVPKDGKKTLILTCDIAASAVSGSAMQFGLNSGYTYSAVGQSSSATVVPSVTTQQGPLMTVL